MTQPRLGFNSDDYITLTDLRDPATGSLVSDATVTAALYEKVDGDWTAVAGADSVTLSPVGGSDGTYRGVKPRTWPLVLGQGYAIIVTIAKGGREVPLMLEAPARYHGQRT